MTKDKTYIGKVEAFEVAMERGIFELPKKNTEVLTVHAIASGKDTEVLGKDAKGYYLGIFED
jgi:predicted RecA/RadA family phage recombinase